MRSFAAALIISMIGLIGLLGVLGCRPSPDRASACVEASCVADAAPTECDSHAQCDGQLCVDGSCVGCSEASQCASTVCNPSGRCEPPPCATDDACPVQQICDGGQCVHEGDDAEPTVCGLAAIYFAHDSAKLTPNNQERLASAMPCLHERLRDGGELSIEAHADNLGTEQYSADLAERRGASVRQFLVSMGIAAERIRVTGKGALEAVGTDESSRARDRKARIIHVAP